MSYANLHRWKETFRISMEDA